MDTISGDAAMPNPPHPPLAGLDPAALLKQGVAADTFLEESRPYDLPLIEDLAVLFPQFEILELIGQGGMGAVYKVRQKELDRIVALKILPRAIGETPGFSERFAREAKALARLNHPGIVTIHEFGKTSATDHPLYFILMEFVDGVNLAQLMKADRIAPREALAIVPQICDALQFAHDQGIVHRDIKPENILMDRLGRVKVADFGIAKVVGNVASADDVQRGGGDGELRQRVDATLGGKIIGTPQYMAPEQLDRPGDVDHRADIYALGVVFYQMLTGELPGKDLQAPSHKVHIDVRLDEMVLRALDSNPERRYQTAYEFRTVLAELPPPQPQPSHAAPTPPTPKHGMIRRWWWMLLVMILLGPVLGLVSGALVAHLVPKKYEAEAIIELKLRDGESPDPDILRLESEKIRSTEALTKVVYQLDLPNGWHLGHQEAVGILKEIVTVDRIPGADLIAVRIRHTDGDEGVKILNAVTANYQRNADREMFIHEDPQIAKFPVSPNLRMIVVVSVVGGLLLSPLMALLLMLFLHRMFPEKPKEKATGGRFPVWVKVMFSAMTAISLAVGGSMLAYVTIRELTTVPEAGETGGATPSRDGSPAIVAPVAETMIETRTSIGGSSQRLRWIVEKNPPLGPEDEGPREGPRFPLKTEAVGWAKPDGRFNPVMYLAQPVSRSNAQGSGRGESEGNGSRRFSLYRGMNPVASANRFLGGYEIKAEPDTDNVNMGFSLSPNGLLYFEVWTDLKGVTLTGWKTRPADVSTEPAAPPSLQERLVDLEIPAITVRKMFLPDHPEVRHAALAVDDFMRANPTAREGAYLDALKRRRKAILVEMEKAALNYSEQHPDRVALKNELDATEQLVRLTRFMVRKPQASAQGEMKYHFDCGGDSMQFMALRIRKEYGLRLSYEYGEEVDHEGEGIRNADLLTELEIREGTGRMTDRERERLEEFRKYQTQEGSSVAVTRYYGEIAATSEKDLLEQLTQDTPYQCRASASGKTWVIFPRGGSKLDYPVKLETRGLTVEQAAGEIAVQSPAGAVRLNPRDGDPAKGTRPWCAVICRPRRFDGQPAWEALCWIGEQADAESMYDLVSVLVIWPGAKWSDPEFRSRITAASQMETTGDRMTPAVDETAATLLANQYLDLVLELAEAEALGFGDPDANRMVRRGKLDRFNASYPDMPDMPDARCLELAAQRLVDLQGRMKTLKDGGLGERHPNYVQLKVRADALTTVIDEKNRGSEPDGKADAGSKHEAGTVAKIHISSSREILLNGAVISREALAHGIKELREKFKDVKVSISGDADVPYAKVMEIIDFCQNNGVWNLTFVEKGKSQIDTVGEWLGMMDAGNYAECYSSSTAAVRRVVSEEKWKNAMAMFRTPLGATVSRKMIENQAVKELPGMPDGEHRVMRFETEFANKKSAVETVIFTKENDGVWKSSGYFIR